MLRHSATSVAMWGFGVGMLVLLRGMLAAAATGGTYAMHDALVDVMAVSIIVAMMRSADLALRGLAARLMERGMRWRAAASNAGRLTLVVGVAAPLLMALAQFCPLRVRSSMTPANLDMPYESVTLESDGLRLAAWHIPCSSSDRPVVVITHGLGINKAGFLHAARIVHDLDCHVLMFDFRAHGDSDGRVTTFGYLEAADVLAAARWAAKAHPASPVIALGYSMGGAAVLRAASQGPGFAGVIVDSTFAQAEEVARTSILRPLGLLQTPAWHAGRFWGWVLSGADLADHQPARCMPGLAGTPVLLIHGQADTLISCEQSQALLRASGGAAELWLPPGANHVQAAMIDPDYAGRIGAFIERVAGRAP